MDIEVGKKYRHIPTGNIVTVTRVDGDEIHLDNGCWATKDTLTSVSNFEKFWEEVADDRVNHPYKSCNDGTDKIKSNIESVSEELNKIIKPEHNRVNHPSYYQDPSGVECITVARYRDFNIGNALKYLWRAGLKTEEGISDIDKQIEDLQKAVFYINDEIELLKGKAKD